MTTSTHSTPSRRRVVQGVAWSAPAVALAAAAPALAASACTPTVRFSGGTWVDFGLWDKQYSTQQLAFGGQVYVDSLPAGVTVTKVTERWFVENAQGQASTDNGYWFMGNSMTNWYKAGRCTAVGCSVQWTGPIGVASTQDNTTKPGAGWSSTVTNTVNNVPTVFSDGVTRNAWDATLTWTPSAGSGITTGTGKCNSFTTGPSGHFGVNYVNAPTKPKGKTVSAYAVVTVTLSNGTVLPYTTQTSTIVNPGR